MNNLQHPTDDEFISLTEDWIEDDMSPEDRQRFADLIEGDPRLRKNFLEAVHLDTAVRSLLSQPHEMPSASDKPVSVYSQKLSTWKRALLPIAACLIGVAGITIWKMGTNSAENTAIVALDDRWHLVATADADYSIISPNLVRLRRGELEFSSTKPAHLTVETPNAVAKAEGTRFLIGHHSKSNDLLTRNKQEQMKMKKMTRMLVYTGMVTMTTNGGSVLAAENEATVAVDDAKPEKIAVTANSKFACNVYSQLLKENKGKNMFFSPYSMSNALLMVAEGAREKTAEEMGLVLGLPSSLRRADESAQRLPWEISKMHNGIGVLNKKFNSKSKSYSLSIANAIWGEKSYPFSSAYEKTISDSYDTNALQSANFTGDPTAETDRINKWTEEQTNGKIKDLFPKGSIDSRTRMALVNAIYFKADWASQFKAKLTKEGQFSLGGGKTTKTKLMLNNSLQGGGYAAFNADGSTFKTPLRIRRGETAGFYPKNDGFAIAELPYKGEKLSMIVIAPNNADGLPAVEKNLTSENLSKWLGNIAKRDINVTLPKFKSETSYTMNDTLIAMGMPTAFQEGLANFDGMKEGESSAGLFISTVVHKAFVEVNEEGAEATAATGANMSTRRVPSTRPFVPEFRADRPFIYLIRDNATGSILFLGRMMNPSS